MKTPTTLKALPGCYDHPHRDWLIGPVGVHRDSDLIEQSNWHAVTEAYAAIDPEQKDHEIHRFGHFAVGWVEEIAYRPDSQVAILADKFRNDLENYPILNEDHHGQLESEARDENSHEILAELRRQLQKIYQTWPEWTEADNDTLGDLSEDSLWEAATGLGEYNEDWIKYSPSEMDEIATKLQHHFGY